VFGILQDPTTYSISGNTLTFSGAPPAATGNISVRYLGIPASGVTTTAYRTVTEYTATSGQTTFTPPSYTAGFISVFRNGVRLGSADYTASNGTTVVLASGATLNDLVTIESYYVSSYINAIPNTAGSVQQTNIGGGVAGTGPNFSAYKTSSTNQTDNTLTAVVFDSTLWNNGSCYNTSTGRFTPNVAGYYQLNSCVDVINSNTGPMTLGAVAIYKNGTIHKYGNYIQAKAPNLVVSATVYANGTTDYFQIYLIETGAVGAYGDTNSGNIWTWFDGSLIRAA
jgi:hypothetical protein